MVPGEATLSLNEAARVVGCDPRTLRRLIHRGELDAYRLGAAGHFRIPLQALDHLRQRARRPYTKPARRNGNDGADLSAARQAQLRHTLSLLRV